MTAHCVVHRVARLRNAALRAIAMTTMTARWSTARMAWVDCRRLTDSASVRTSIAVHHLWSDHRRRPHWRASWRRRCTSSPRHLSSLRGPCGSVTVLRHCRRAPSLS